jgi:hypothetical protein
MLVAAAGCGVEGSANPPSSLRDSDLVGTWEVSYGGSEDRLCLRADGTFKQIYVDGYKNGYRYETPWERWWLERLPGGAVRLHLLTARYYRRGIWRAELDGWWPDLPTLESDGWRPTAEPSTMSLWDPFTDELVGIPEKLVLEVRQLQSGELVLFHLLDGGDDAYSLFSGSGDVFRRIATPTPGGEPCAFDAEP